VEVDLATYLLSVRFQLKEVYSSFASRGRTRVCSGGGSGSFLTNHKVSMYQLRSSKESPQPAIDVCFRILASHPQVRSIVVERDERAVDRNNHFGNLEPRPRQANNNAVDNNADDTSAFFQNRLPVSDDVLLAFVGAGGSRSGLPAAPPSSVARSIDFDNVRLSADQWRIVVRNCGPGVKLVFGTSQDWTTGGWELVKAYRAGLGPPRLWLDNVGGIAAPYRPLPPNNHRTDGEEEAGFDNSNEVGGQQAPRQEYPPQQHWQGGNGGEEEEEVQQERRWQAAEWDRRVEEWTALMGCIASELPCLEELTVTVASAALPPPPSRHAAVTNDNVINREEDTAQEKPFDPVGMLFEAMRGNVGLKALDLSYNSERTWKSACGASFAAGADARWSQLMAAVTGHRTLRTLHLGSVGKAEAPVPPFAPSRQRQQALLPPRSPSPATQEGRDASLVRCVRSSTSLCLVTYNGGIHDTVHYAQVAPILDLNRFRDEARMIRAEDDPEAREGWFVDALMNGGLADNPNRALHLFLTNSDLFVRIVAAAVSMSSSPASAAAIAESA
jgi:hypothetical protein